MVRERAVGLVSAPTLFRTPVTLTRDVAVLLQLVDAYACESMAYATTGMIDRGDPSCELEAAICKVRVHPMCAGRRHHGLTF